ncbi:MAG: BREX-3 system P-loop-containing protein BrxF [Magnetococcus sp. WYHC-3]
MTDTQIQSALLDAVGQAGQLFHRLILLVGPSGSGKTRLLRDVGQATGWPVINLNLELSKGMLELSSRKRAMKAGRLMAEIVERDGSDVTLLDNLELLFEPSLMLDPLRLLQGMARDRTVVAAWNGRLTDGHLVYAEPGHPEHRRAMAKDLLIVELGNQ